MGLVHTSNGIMKGSDQDLAEVVHIPPLDKNLRFQNIYEQFYFMRKIPNSEFQYNFENQILSKIIHRFYIRNA